MSKKLFSLDAAFWPRDGLREDQHRNKYEKCMRIKAARRWAVQMNVPRALFGSHLVRAFWRRDGRGLVYLALDETSLSPDIRLREIIVKVPTVHVTALFMHISREIWYAPAPRMPPNHFTWCTGTLVVWERYTFEFPFYSIFCVVWIGTNITPSHLSFRVKLLYCCLIALRWVS